MCDAKRKILAPMLPVLLAGLSLFSYTQEASAFLNRSYSTLEKSIILKGDFDNIIRHGKLRILLTQDLPASPTCPAVDLHWPRNSAWRRNLRCRTG